MFLSTDEDNNKIMCRADVPKDIVKSKGLDAREWCDQVKELIGGKGMSSLVFFFLILMIMSCSFQEINS